MIDLKSIFRRIRDKIDFHLPPFEITPERENEMIEMLAGQISKRGLEFPALMIGWQLAPVSKVIAYSTILPVAPFLEFVGLQGFELVNFLSDQENVRRLLKRIEELEDEKAKTRGFWR
jgi:hypothetical protein